MEENIDTGTENNETLDTGTEGQDLDTGTENNETLDTSSEGQDLDTGTENNETGDKDPLASFKVDGELDVDKVSKAYQSLRGKLGAQLADAATNVDEYDYQPEGSVVTDQEELDQFKEFALKNNYSAEQYKETLDLYMKNINGLNPAVDEEAAKVEMIESTTSNLKEAWADDYQSNLDDAMLAVNNLDNINIEDVKGNAAAIKLLSMLGREMHEDNAPNSTDNSNTGMTRLELDEMMQESMLNGTYFNNSEKEKVTDKFFGV